MDKVGFVSRERLKEEYKSYLLSYAQHLVDFEINQGWVPSGEDILDSLEEDEIYVSKILKNYFLENIRYGGYFYIDDYISCEWKKSFLKNM